MTKKTIQDITPLMATASSVTDAGLKTRRNIAGTIERTDRFHNIEFGLVPFKYSNPFTYLF